MFLSVSKSVFTEEVLHSRDASLSKEDNHSKSYESSLDKSLAASKESYWKKSAFEIGAKSDKPFKPADIQPEFKPAEPTKDLKV